MSWQSYVDDHLLCPLPNGGTLEHAAIYGQDGGVWAQSPDFPHLSPEEVEAINKGLENPRKLAETGLYIGGTKYLVISSEEGVVLRGRKGPAGVTVKKTASALVIGIYDQTVQPADANVVVENLGDYLLGQGI